MPILILVGIVVIVIWIIARACESKDSAIARFDKNEKKQSEKISRQWDRMHTAKCPRCKQRTLKTCGFSGRCSCGYSYDESR
jgi:hypothetical protein